MEEDKFDLCPVHNLKYDMYCVTDKKKICCKCIWEHTKMKHEVMAFSDYQSEILLRRKANLSSLIEENSSKIDSENLKFYSESKNLLEETRLLKKTTTTLLEHIETLERILATISENSGEIKLSSKLKTILENMKGESVEIKEVLEYDKKIHNIEQQISFFLNYGDAYSTMKNKFLHYQKNIIENTSLNEILTIYGNIFTYMFSEFWSLDSKNMSANLKLSNNNLTVEKVNDKCFGSVIGSIEFVRGKHQWDVRIDSLNMSESRKNSWVCIGVIEKKCFDINNTFNYPHACGVSTIAQKYQIGGYTEIIQPGDSIHLELDSDAGTFHILGKGIDLKASGLQGKVMVPFVELHDIGCKCKITPIH